MKTYRIAVIAGDGIGKEVIPAGIEVMKMAAEQGGFTCEFTRVPVGMRLLPADRPDDGRRRRRPGSASSTRSIWAPSAIRACADHISARELILPLRQRLGQ